MTIQRCDKCGSSLGTNGSEDTQLCLKCTNKEKKCCILCDANFGACANIICPCHGSVKVPHEMPKYSSENPVQESVAPGAVSHASSIHPDAGEWENKMNDEFDHKWLMIAHAADKGDDRGPHGYGELIVRIRQELKSFIRSQIEAEKQRADYNARQDIVKSYGDYHAQEMALEEGAKIERSHLSEEIGKLRANENNPAEFGEWVAVSYVEKSLVNAVLDAILKVLHEV